MYYVLYNWNIIVCDEYYRVMRKNACTSYAKQSFNESNISENLNY
jgi:hypothetical protein